MIDMLQFRNPGHERNEMVRNYRREKTCVTSALMESASFNG